jgi:hypothetical protein
MSNRRAFGRTTTDLSLLRAGPGAGGVVAPSPTAGATQSPTPLPPSQSMEHDNSRKRTKRMAQVHVMAYLTPHKISILILIEYFCQHQSPQNDVQKLSQFLLKCIQVTLNVARRSGLLYHSRRAFEALTRRTLLKLSRTLQSIFKTTSRGLANKSRVRLVNQPGIICRRL